MIRLSIVIVSWNTRALLEQCLASIYTHPPSVAFETIVVDNASRDGSADAARQGFPQARLIENAVNVGFAPANNQAIELCQGELVLLLNPDTRVLPGALDAMIRFMDEHPQAGAAGARVLNPDGTLQTSCYPAPTLSRELWRLFHLDRLRAYGVYDMAGWDVRRSRQVDAVLGACLIARRRTLDQVGALDPDYFFTGEEIDLCHRIRSAGWSIHWIPQAGIIHYGGQSARQVAAQSFLHLYQGKVLYFRKRHGWLTAQLYKLVVAAATLSRLLLSPLAWLEPAERRRQHLSLAGHYWRLLLRLPTF